MRETNLTQFHASTLLEFFEEYHVTRDGDAFYFPKVGVTPGGVYGLEEALSELVADLDEIIDSRGLLSLGSEMRRLTTANIELIRSHIKSIEPWRDWEEEDDDALYIVEGYPLSNKIAMKVAYSFNEIKTYLESDWQTHQTEAT